MAKLEPAVPGTVVWVDLQTPDLVAARKFYGQLFGWSFVGGEDPNLAFYTMAQLGGRNVAGMAKLGGQSPFPPAWSVYLASANADETARKVAEAGGKVVAPPMDIAQEGRMTYCADPTGAHFGVWQARNHQGAQVVGEPGAMTWHEVYTRDAARAREFYTRVFGLTAQRLDAPGIDYWTLHKGPERVCGVMQMTDQFPKEVPPHWNTYFAVGDADSAAAKAVSLGGKQVAPPFDTGFGRIAVVADPFGAAFCLVKLSRPVPRPA